MNGSLNLKDLVGAWREEGVAIVLPVKQVGEGPLRVAMALKALGADQRQAFFGGKQIVIRSTVPTKIDGLSVNLEVDTYFHPHRDCLKYGSKFMHLLKQARSDWRQFNPAFVG